MKIKSLLNSALVASVLAFSSCDKDDNDPAPNPGPGDSGPGTVMIAISNIAGAINVDETGGTTYTNGSNEPFTVTSLRYYVSNFELFNDNMAYSVPNSYFLVDESDFATTEFNLDSVPEGYYKGVRFMIGVDEDKFNELTGQNPASITGPLDPANGMMWMWHSGYIHYKLEGTFANSPDSMYFYHIGGMTGANAGQRTVEILFAGDSLKVKGSQVAQIHLLADVLKVFDGTTPIMLSSVSNVMTVNPTSNSIANNYATMFEFNHLHN